MLRPANTRFGLPFAAAVVLSAALIPCAWASHSEMPVCDSERERGAWESGRTQGIRVVESAWESVGESCDQLSRLDSVVRDNLDRYTVPDDASSYVECRHAGVIAGAEEKLAAIAAECDC